MSLALDALDPIMRTPLPPLLFASLLGLHALACDAGAPSPAAKSEPAADAKPANTKQPAADAKPDPGQADAKPNDPEQAHTKLDTKRADAKKAEAKTKFEDHDQASVKATKTKLLTMLNEGRKLVKDGKLDEGMAKYHALLAIDPHYGPALGELGWAEFKAEMYESARMHTLKAIALAPDDRRRGMFHYNLGRIAEAQGRTEAAIESYALSLRLRPHDVVAARLAELTHVESAEGFAAEHPAVETYETLHGADAKPTPFALRVEHGDQKDMKAVCEQLVPDANEWDSCELCAPVDDDSWGVIAIDWSGIEKYWHPALKTDAGWQIYEAALVGQHGSEIDQDVDGWAVRSESNDAGSFLWIDYSDHIYQRTWYWDEELVEEGEDDMVEDDSEDSEGVILCRRAPAPVCTSPILTKWRYYGSKTISYDAKVTLEGDVIVISEVKTEGPIVYENREDPWEVAGPLPAGKYPFPSPKK